jgi:hypothetical protein
MESKAKIGDRTQEEIDSEIPNHTGTCAVQQDPGLAPDGLPGEASAYGRDVVPTAPPMALIGSFVSTKPSLG